MSSLFNDRKHDVVDVTQNTRLGSLETRQGTDDSTIQALQLEVQRLTNYVEKLSEGVTVVDENGQTINF